MQNIPRIEYPRPDFVRDSYINLNGEWYFEKDGGKSGRQRGLIDAEVLSDKITVPFCMESKLSGVADTDFCDSVWYKKEIDVSEDMLFGGNRVLLHIGACDYFSEVWVNGKTQGTHRGGYTPFCFDITDSLKIGKNIITVCAEDDVRSHDQPGGKQSTKYASYGCSYTRTTGIWQTVWIETVPSTYIESVRYFTDIESGTLTVNAHIVGGHGKTISLETYFEGTSTGEAKATVCGEYAILTLKLSEIALWDIGAPNLYDATFKIENDVVNSYFGLRTVAYVDGKFLLNSRPVFQRLVLDQGFYPDGIYTAPSDEALKNDILLSKAMGFNGARLHQKIFEPRFLYHCDKEGYIVWGEHANWGQDISKDGAWMNFLPEWLEALKRDCNHPSIIGWCPLNETQEDQNNEFVNYLAAVTRAFDPSRLIIDSSGWMHVDGSGTDIYDCHDYLQDAEQFKARYEKLARGEKIPMLRHGEGMPTFVSEYGGIWWSDRDVDGWGYGERPKSREEFLARLKGLTDALIDCPAISGFCYTQLTDVEQEQNGLYTYDRVPKFDPELIAPIFSREAASERMFDK